MDGGRRDGAADAMPPRPEPAALDGVAALLRDLVHDHTGLFLDNGEAELLVDKLAPLLDERGLRSYLDYYYLLKDEGPDEEWARVHDALAVQETYFWREIDAVRAVVDVMVPRWVDALRGQPLTIWSVPCASGEEPLTVAMVLQEAGWFDRAPIELHASDASPAALARARLGLYREHAFRSLPPAMRERYFTPTRNGWRVSPALHARIAWSRVNVVVPGDVERLATSPIIFCRNLFIYFSPTSVRRVTDAFERGMPAGGCLCLGVSEYLRASDAFTLEEIGGAFMYVKR